MAIYADNQSESNSKGQKQQNKIPFAGDLYGCVQKLPEKPYSGVPPRVSEELKVLAKKAWDYYKFGNELGKLKEKYQAPITDAFNEREFTTTVYVLAGIINFLKKNGPVEVPMANGSKVTISESDITPDLVAEIASFTAFNAALFGRVGTVDSKFFADNVFLHLASSPANSDSSFMVDTAQKDRDSLLEVRPLKKSEYKNLRQTVKDAIKDKKLLDAYQKFIEAVPVPSEDMYAPYLQKDYGPVTKNGKQGNVELLSLPLFVIAAFKKAREILPSLKPKQELPPAPLVFTSPVSVTEDKPVADLGYTRVGINFDSRAIPPKRDIKYLRDLGVPSKNVFDMQSVSDGTPGQLFSDIAHINTLVSPNGKILSVGGIDFNDPKASYDNVKALVEFIIDNRKGDNGTFTAKTRDGKAYAIDYNFSVEGETHKYDVRLSPVGASSSAASQPMITFSGDYSKVTGANGVALHSMNVSATVPSGSMAGKGSFEFYQQELKNGNFDLRLLMADANGRKVTLGLSGANFNFLTSRFADLAWMPDDPLQSYALVDGKKITISDIVHNTAGARGKLFGTVSDSLKSGYVSFEGGYDPVSLSVANFNLVPAITKDSNGNKVRTFKADNVRVGLQGNENIEANFRDSQFRINFGGSLTEGQFDAEWSANGRQLVKIHVPQLTDAQADRMSSAADKFLSTISDRTSQVGFFSALKEATDGFTGELRASVSSASVELNQPALLGAFEPTSWLGRFAKYGLGPGLELDAANGGRIILSVEEIGQLADVFNSGDKGKFEKAAAILAPKLGLQQGQSLIDNEVMGLYACNFNIQKDLMDRAIRGHSMFQAFASHTQFGTASMDKIGASMFMPITDMRNQEDFGLYATATASFDRFDVSPFGKPADMANIRMEQRSFDVIAGVGAKYANLDFGFDMVWSLKLEEGISVENQLKDGDTFFIRLDDTKKGKFYGYARATYHAEGSAGKLAVSFIGGLVPAAVSEYYAGMNSDVLLFRAGAQVTGETGFSLTPVSRFVLTGALNVPNLARGNLSYDLGAKYILTANEDLRFYGSVGVQGTVQENLSPFHAPYVGAGVEIGDVHRLTLDARWSPKNVRNTWSFGISYAW